MAKVAFTYTLLIRIYERAIMSFLQTSIENWRQVLAVVTLVARHDPRLKVADAAAGTLTTVIQTYGPAWQPAVWSFAWQKGFSYLLSLPPLHATPEEPVVRCAVSMNTTADAGHWLASIA